MKSMTSYGYAEFSDENYLMTMELKSYNNRFLELSYNSPSILSPFENEVNEVLKKHAQRGHIDFSVKLKTVKGKSSFDVDSDVVASYANAIKEVEKALRKEGIKPKKVNAAMLLSMDGVIFNNNADSFENYREGFESCLCKVMEMFDSSKDREGLATQKDLASKIESIEKSLEVVKSHASELETQIKTGLTEKMNDMLKDQSYDENRILQEVAVMLMRYTINEEIVRLSAHIAEFKRLLVSSEAVGKRIDFLCQEMNREINTIGSKSQMVEINFEVVNMKDCLENIREQVRNIE